MRRLVAALSALAFVAVLLPGVAAPVVLAAPLGCPAGSPNFESRGWWTLAGVSIDLYRGVDLEVCAPARLSGDVPITLHVQLRHNFATINLLRVQIADDHGQVVAFQQSVHLSSDPVTGDGEWFVPAVLHSTVAAHDGWKELRFTANIATDEFGKRQYQSTGIQAFIANGKPLEAPYRQAPWWEARGWYQDVEYENVRLRQDPPSAPVSGIWSVRWQAVPGSGGRPITFHAAYVNANTHAIPMDLPFTYDAGAGGFDGTTRIDTTKLPNGVNKLLLRADARVAAGTDSGLLQILFNVANGSGGATPTPVPSPVPTATPVITPAPTPTATAAPTPTSIPSPTASICGG